MMKPHLQESLAALRLDITYERAAGDHLFHRDEHGREIEVLDMVGGYGSLLLGHAHPTVVAEARRMLDEARPVHVQGSNRSYARRLAEELARRVGGDHVAVLANSGAEGVEAAIKHTMLATGRKTFIALEGAFHGKTLGALQLTHNPWYREAFALLGLRVLHVRRDDIAALEAAFGEAGDDVAGFVYEPVLGEGGVRPLTPAFVQRAEALCRARGAALIADECQTGIGRTGRFLASEGLGVTPDVIVLSKALGGGLAKVAACLIRRAQYVPGFDLRHTSTFAEDDHSSAIALAALGLVDDTLLADVRGKGEALLASLRGLRRRHPDVIREVRGAGLMLGVEFRSLEACGDGFLLRYLSSREEFARLLTGYLLHEHRIRVMPMLSDPFTLRLQPSAFLSEADAQRFVGALDDVCERIRRNDVATLTRFLVEQRRPDGPRIPAEADGFFAWQGERFWQRRRTLPRRRVGWIFHLVDADDLVTLEPGLAHVPRLDRETILRDGAAGAVPVVMSSVDVHARSGDAVQLECILLPFTSSWVKACMARGDLRLARALVQRGVDLARDLGCSMTALGQYTSIVTANGTRLRSGDMGLTSGNSYAVALAVEAVHRAMGDRGLPPGAATLAVVGAAGNIGRTCASILAPGFARTLLIGRDTPGAKARLENLARGLPTDRVQLGCDPALVHEADVVVSAPNTAGAFLRAEHFRPDAIVCDLSVPASVHPETARLRPDVLCIKGGVARLPRGDDLELPGFRLPPGQIYACMAEAVLLGLEGIRSRAFTGTLRPEGVRTIGHVARRHGFELDGYKTACVFGSDPRPATEESGAQGRYRAAN